MVSRRSLTSSPIAKRPAAFALALASVLAAAALPDARAAAGGSLASLDQEMLARTPAHDRAPQTLYLDIVIDGRVVRPLVRFNAVGERLSVEPLELTEAGLLLPAGLETDGQGRIALDAIAGLGVRYESTLQRVVLTPARELRPIHRLGYRNPEPVVVDRDHGLVLDWDTYARHTDQADTLSLGTGARWFGRYGSLELTGVSRAGDGGDDAYARLDTRWSYSDPRRMWTWSAGDLVSGGLAWTRPVRLGGVQWRRNFSVRPDLIVYPLPQFSADAVVPSSVELYVNNIRQYGQDVQPGPFVLSEFPRVVGAGQAVVVVTDALGRSSQTSVSLYSDYQRLAPGLNDFSLEAGLLRRGFGVVSNDYGADPVASASWRHGLRQDVTIELHGEAGPGLQLAGAGLAWSPFARYGVVIASYAHSTGDATGRQRAAGYQWFGQRAGFDLYAQRASAGFRDLGTLDGGSRPLRAQDRASAWWTIPRGSLSLTWLRYRDPDSVASRTVSLGVSQSFRRLALSANAFDDDRAGRGVSLSLSVPLGAELNASLNIDHVRDDTAVVADVRRTAPYEGGWGWQAQVRDNGDGQVGAHWRASTGEFRLGVDRVNDRTGGFAQGNGSLVWMGGEGFASRRISDGFAVVSTNGIADVPILYENRIAGRTNAGGYLLLTDLRGWQRNRVAFDPDALPAGFKIPAIERMVTPADHSGVHVRFGLAPLRAATVLLHDAHGQPVVAGSRVRRADDSEAIVGFDGELWLEHYVDGETLRWSRAGKDCAVTLPALGSARTTPRPGPLACQPDETP